MTAKEFLKTHHDAFGKELSWDDLLPKANGAALFYLSLTNGKAPKEDRKVLWAGYVLAAGIHVHDEYLAVLRRTDAGNAKVDHIDKASLSPEGRVLIFEAEPMHASDPRNMEPWSHWM